jgi:hypothetical protein
MFISDASVSNKVVSIKDYIDHQYLTIEELNEELNNQTPIIVTEAFMWSLLSNQGFVVENCQYGHQLTEKSRAFTTRVYKDKQLQILWNRNLIPLLLESVNRLFGK